MTKVVLKTVAGRQFSGMNPQLFVYRGGYKRQKPHALCSECGDKIVRGEQYINDHPNHYCLGCADWERED